MADLPSGAVTFLFTDIEGSTRLVKQLREGYAEVLHEHQRVLRAAFMAHGGHEVDTQGDSFFVAFASARDALLAAVEGQLALLSHSWPEGAQIKVRMGLHTGQALASGGRYTGLAVHRAARIGAAGHGGQVLVSQATQTLLEDEEEDLHVVLRDLGDQRLKDLDRPVRLYQAEADGLLASFPPLRHEAEPAEAAEAAIRPPPPWRRPAVLGAAGLALVAVLAAAVLLATRDSAGKLSAVEPNNVGVIDPQKGEIVMEIPVGHRPGPVAHGAGFLWVGNLDDGTLTKIDLRQRTNAGLVQLGERTPTGIAFGARAVWVAHGLLGSISRVDPQFDKRTSTIPVTASAGTGHGGVVDVDAGSVWAVFGDSTLVRIDPPDARPSGRTLAGSRPSAVVVADGAVWVANSGANTVFRFNPATFEEAPVKTITVGQQPGAIGFGEGALWVANTSSDNVYRIDPASNSVSSVIPVGDGPTALAVGSGAVWVSNTAAGTISRIDPRTNNVSKTITVGNAPWGIAVADGLVWVAVQAP